ncbi:hypothetical protein MKZ21_24805 [Paenibacillus sp. FSL P2-0536]|uniref:hypothetical protein n=1 Tax=Paenibacillus TaxID=44249 RepID=UPI0006918D5F|nr:hypothetical protein [Paenibacillus odorifer]
MDTLITAFIAPVVIAAIISAIVSRSNNNKTMSLKYITEERAAWRKEIKETVSVLYSGKYEGDERPTLKKLTTLLILNLNPLQEKENTLDLHIIELLKAIESGDDSMTTLEDLRDSVGILLKHDWERSKNETKSFLTRLPKKEYEKRVLGKYYSE